MDLSFSNVLQFSYVLCVNDVTAQHVYQNTINREE